MSINTVSSFFALIASVIIFRMRNRMALFAVWIIAISMISSVQSVFAATGNPGDFFRSAVGDWIGTCEQKTNGEKADNKYFHASVKQASPSEYVTHFEYFITDTTTGKLQQIGESMVKTTLGQNGCATKSIITGKGTVLVNYKPKTQEHELTETQTCIEPSSLQGIGGGKVSVHNMPFGLGNNGKVRESKTAWSLKNDVLSIDQKLSVCFKALIFSKSFTMEAHYTARRGTDVAILVAHNIQVSSAIIR